MEKRVHYYRNIYLLYLSTFFHALIPAYAIERLFWQERGMSVAEVIYCEFIYAAIIIVLEVPSGVWADRYGRRRMLVLDGLFTVIETGILLFAHSFWIFGLSVFLSGIGHSLYSGSQNALLYDSLAACGKENQFEKIRGRLLAIDFASLTLAFLCGAPLAHWRGYEFTYVVSVIAFSLSCICMFFLKEPLQIMKADESLVTGMDYFRQACRFFKSHPVVLLYSVTGAYLGAAMIYADEFWQLMLNDTGINLLFFGIVGAAYMLARVPGNLIAYRLKEWFSYRRVFQFLLLAYTGLFFALFYARGWWCVLILILLALVSGASDPLMEGYLHHHCSSNIRATVESAVSLILRLFAILLGLFFGYLGTRYSIFTGFLFLSVFTAFYLMVYSKLYPVK